MKHTLWDAIETNDAAKECHNWQRSLREYAATSCVTRSQTMTGYLHRMHT